MNLLNSNEAFSALMAGKNIMCRAVGELMEFDDLDQFPATVFAMHNYEFCIKIDEITINGYTFLKPYSLEELSEGQDVFLLGNTGSIVKGQFIPEYEELVLAVKNGSVQRDFESAQNQAKAMQSLLGINNDLVLKVVNFQEFMKPKAKPKKITRKKTESIIETAQEVVNEPTTESRKGFTIEEVSEIETDSEKLVEKFTAQIVNCASTSAVLSLRNVFMCNGNLEREQHQYLCRLTEEKLLELDPEQYAPTQSYIDHQIYIDGINACVSEEEIKTTLHDVNYQGFSEEQLSEINLAKCSKLAEFRATALKNIQDNQYENLLKELLERAQKSKLPAEANALYKYTVNWTEEQRKPLMDAINKRLSELGATAPPPEQPPSLVVQIQNAPDLTALDILEIDVATRHPDIQPKLMGLVRKRRFELENSVSKVVENEI